MLLGRHNKVNGANQRSGLKANKESRRHINDNIFGAHRLLSDKSSAELHELLKNLQAEDDIPASVELKPSLRVTLLERNNLKRSLMHGIIGGYHLGRALAELEKGAGLTKNENIRVDLGKICLMDKRNNSITVSVSDNSVVEAEHQAIVGILSDMGLRGLNDHAFKPHITLANCRRPMTMTEKKHVQHVLVDVLPKQVMLLPLDFTPPLERH